MYICNPYVIGKSYMATGLTHTKADHSESHFVKHYIYTLSEIERLLTNHRVRTIAVYHSTEMRNYQPGDQQLYLVAARG